MIDLTHLDLQTRRRLAAHLETFVSDERLAKFRAVLDQRTRHLTVALQDVYQPHNASAVLRSCECFGVQDVQVIESQYEFRPNRGVVMGADKWLTIRRYDRADADNTARCLDDLRHRGYVIAATALEGATVALPEVPLDRPLALVFGTEDTGLTSDAMAQADLRMKIPMVGFTQSLNISVSAALCLRELTNRLRRSDVDWRLRSGEREMLWLEWLCQSVHRGPVLVRDFLRKCQLSTNSALVPE